MTKGLVLGGGGPVGIGWEAGLIVGLAGAGVDLSTADQVLGTSAGSVAGFTLASGRDLSEGIGVMQEVSAHAGEPEAAQAASGLDEILASGALGPGDSPEAEAARARVGRVAVENRTIDEAVWLQMFDYFDGMAWPESFACTAVDTDTGRFRVWTAADGVEPARAVASSCAVPGVFPPVTIDGRRWMDGGVRDLLNADVASGHRAVLAVSCTVLELPEGLSLPGMEALFATIRARIDRLTTAGARVETIVPGPEMLEVSEWGLRLLDFSRTPAAFEAGLAQAAREAGRVQALWES